MFDTIYGMLLTHPGEMELAENLEKANVVIDEKKRNEAFFEALNERIKGEGINEDKRIKDEGVERVFTVYQGKAEIRSWTALNRTRPSAWGVFVAGEHLENFKSKKAALQYAYLHLLKPEALRLNEAAIRNQEAPGWYKTGDPLSEVKQ